MAKILTVFLMLLGSTIVAAPVAAQEAETYEDIVADPSLTADDATVVRLYQAVFARQPDPGGLRFWLDTFDTGEWSTRRIAGFFATSDEFIALYGETDNQAFMTAVYSNVLGRAPDAEGGAFWTDQLDGGMSRAEMILLISNAPEFIDANLILADNQAEEGLRYDYGEIERVEVVGGVTWVWFDRWTFGIGLDDAGGYTTLQGVQHVVEPRWELATDWHGGGNMNPRQRRYPLSPSVSVLEIFPGAFDAVCGGETDTAGFLESDAATFFESDIATVAGHRRLSSLTFNPDGEATLVRDQGNC